MTTAPSLVKDDPIAHIASKLADWQHPSDRAAKELLEARLGSGGAVALDEILGNFVAGRPGIFATYRQAWDVLCAQARVTLSEQRDIDLREALATAWHAKVLGPGLAKIFAEISPDEIGELRETYLHDGQGFLVAVQQHAKRAGDQDAINLLVVATGIKQRIADMPLAAEATGAAPFLPKGPRDLAKSSRPAWVVKGLATTGEVILLFGKPGSHKSCMALDLALSVADGRDSWAGCRIKTARRGVAILQYEGVGASWDRCLAWSKSRLEDPTSWFLDHPGAADNLRFLPPVSFLDGAEFGRLRTHFQDQREDDRPALIIVDTVSCTIAGGDENNQQAGSLFVSRCQELAQLCQAAVVAVHHSNRGGNEERGSSTFRANVDTVLKAEPLKSEGEGYIKLGVDGKSRNTCGTWMRVFKTGAWCIGEDEDQDPITAPSVEYVADLADHNLTTTVSPSWFQCGARAWSVVVHLGVCPTESQLSVTSVAAG